MSFYDYFFVCAFPLKQTGTVLKFLSENSFSEVKPLKRVKKFDDQYNLIIIENLNLEYLQKDLSDSEIVTLIPYSYSSIHQENISKEVLKRLLCFENKFKEMSKCFILKILKSSDNLVILNRQLI